MTDETIEIDATPEPQSQDSGTTDDVVLFNEPAPETESAPAPEPVKQQAAPKPAEKERDYKAEYENLRGALKETREQIASFETLRSELEEYRKQQQAAKQKEEFDTDPLTSIQKEIEDLKHEKQTRAQQEAQAKKEAEQQESVRAFVVRSREEFEKETPDYQQAYSFLADRRTKELMAVGFRDQYTLNQALEMEMQRIVNHAIGSGENPARLVYNLAVANGYQNQGGQMADNKGATETLTRISEGQKAASNSGRGSKNSANNGAVRLSDIENMSADEFDEVWNKLRRQGRLG